MRYSADEYEYEQEHGPNMVLIYMALIMSTVVLVVVGLMFLINQPQTSSAKSSQTAKQVSETQAMVDSVNELVSGSTLTSDQLDIWNLPDTGRTESKTDDGTNGTVTNQTTGETITQSAASASESSTDGTTQTQTQTGEAAETADAKDALDDGNHTLVTYADGTTEWLAIDQNLTLNTYDTSQFQYYQPEMKYFVNGKQASWFGVTISSKQGVVDYEKLKKAGVDYCMIKAGGRGYSSGKIVMDSNAEDNLKGAKNAGLGIGVYFYSQAVDKEEIYDEVDALLNLIEDYPIDYPVVFDMESVEGDMARTDALDQASRTELAKTFLKELEAEGYHAMLYGNKEWLLTKLDLEELAGYDVWLAQEGDEPDYPYEYTMWQYTASGKVSGISEEVALSVSLVDYSEE